MTIVLLFSIKGLYFRDKISFKSNKNPMEFIEKETHFDGPAQFAKIHNHIRSRNDNEKPKYKPGYILKEFNKAKKSLQYRDPKKLNWKERGPANVGGRTRGLLVDPDDSTHHTFFAGSVGGGVWKTTNACETWENLTEDLPNLATSTLAMSAHNTSVIYVGTGEGFDNRMVDGSGIWKSEDKGESWSALSSTTDNDKFLNVFRLIVDPENENVLLSCTSGRKDSLSFILKSTDGGQTWTEKFQLQNHDIQQLVYTPGDFSVMYATALNFGVLKSTDRGETWNQVFDSQPKEIGRIELAVSPVNPAYVYLSCESQYQSILIFSKDSMKTTSEIIFSDSLTPNWLSFQGWYDNTIAAHPYKANIVWVGGSGSILEIDVDKEEKNIKVLKEFENNTSFLQELDKNVYSLDGDGQAKDVFQIFNFTSNTSEDDLVNVEIRFGKNKKQMAHLITWDYATFAFKYIKMIEVPFESWDLENNRQTALSILDMDGDEQWTFKDYSDEQYAFPDIVFVNMFDYKEEADSIIANDINTANKAVYYFFKGKNPDFNGSIDSLPDGNLMFKTGYIKGIIGRFNPVTDGYSEYTNISQVGSKGVHVDHHNIIFIPVDSAESKFYVLNANDGGVAFSDDNGKTFKQTGDTFSNFDEIDYNTSDGYNVSQFYGVDKMNGSDRFIGGTQDNGSWISPIDPDATTKWIGAPSGDGFEAAWNYAIPEYILESSQGNVIYKSYDNGETWNYVDLPESQGPFITRIASSQIDPNLVFVSSDQGLIKSTDFGETWSIKSMPLDWQFSFFGPPVKISLADANIVWSGSGISSNNRIAISKDKGETWTSTANYDKAYMGNVTGIATHPLNKSTAYILFSQANGPKILKTDDFGETWTDISGFETDSVEESRNGFPNVATYSLLVMPFDTNIIWAGTEIGLFESIDNGNSWHYANNGLPAVGIWQMKIVNNQIVLATHGRGIWTLDTDELVATHTPVDESIDFDVFPNPVHQNAFIIFNVPHPTDVEISLYTLDGKKIKNILKRKLTGNQKIGFNSNGLISGTYIITLRTKHGNFSRKIIIAN